MAEVFIEQLVKQKTPAYKLLIKYVLLALTVVAAVAGFLILPLLLCLALIFGFLYWWYGGCCEIEYEYSCLNGDVDIDKIIGQQKRKGVIRMVMGKVEVVAPTGSSHLKEHSYTQARVLDCSSKQKDAKTYTIIYNGDDGRFEVIIEPDEEVLQAMKSFAPRKVIIE